MINTENHLKFDQQLLGLTLRELSISLTVNSAITNWSFYNHRQSICQYMYVHFCYFSSSHVHSRYDLLVWFEICELAPNGE